jgi:hypothetical protein
MIWNQSLLLFSSEEWMPARCVETAETNHLRPREAAGFASGTRPKSRGVYSTTFQVASGLNWAIEAPRAAVFGPKSFWKTTPFSPQMNVSTPLSP